MGMILYNL